MPIHAKLLDFQRKKVEVPKKGRNPAFHSTYSELSDVLDAVTGPLNEIGVVLVQTPKESGLLTQLVDAEDSTFVEGFVPYVDAATAQRLGGNITYARRYSIVAMLGLKEVDDDGNAASEAPRRPATPSVAQAGTAAPERKKLEDGDYEVDVTSTKEGEKDGRAWQLLRTSAGDGFNSTPAFLTRKELINTGTYFVRVIRGNIMKAEAKDGDWSEGLDDGDGPDYNGRR